MFVLMVPLAYPITHYTFCKRLITLAEYQKAAHICQILPEDITQTIPCYFIAVHLFLQPFSAASITLAPT